MTVLSAGNYSIDLRSLVVIQTSRNTIGIFVILINSAAGSLTSVSASLRILKIM